MAKLFRTAIMGPPGSGKGTISKRIAQNFGLQYLSSGHFLREGIAANTDAGVLVKGYVERSMLVPDHLMSRLMLPRLEQLTGHSWLLDGFPRTIAQAKALNDIFQMDLVISLNIPFETLRERVSDRWIHPASGRVYNMGFNPPQVQGRDDVTGEPLIQHADDRPEALQARLRHYKDVAKPVMNLYKCLRQEKRITQQRRSSKQTAWFPVQRHPVPVLGYRHRPHLALHQLSSQH
ncbi:adenylate kinase 4, mitochondrial isoform X1 [Gadus macrocephalus]|uniref:adenylate kinase 4, mitochondrial isoform X1 n=1 Tax=Gadus macrocephalus TaxID=80720 RepID=UPI0028CB55E2|nr:adenylate kinase 4, mitochondrial isoform X1 [Gadus macrocephalus]XP_059922320.1 adenylate kinase 4, mitochondrial isoform X1 [Gadus macrocephalus]